MRGGPRPIQGHGAVGRRLQRVRGVGGRDVVVCGRAAVRCRHSNRLRAVPPCAPLPRAACGASRTSAPLGPCAETGASLQRVRLSCRRQAIGRHVRAAARRASDLGGPDSARRRDAAPFSGSAAAAAPGAARPGKKRRASSNP